jgi:4a-hydroxytetrahydrobiopterin dehydratase
VSEPRLTAESLDAALRDVPEWALVGEAIQRTYTFKDFVTAMQFVGRVAQHAEQAAHHPDIMIRYAKVTLTLSTHDSGGITAKDFASAKAADDAARLLPGPVAAAKPARPASRETSPKRKRG